MNHQQIQVRNWMDTRERTVRYTPVDHVPIAERFSQIQRLVDSLWKLSSSMGVLLGQKPTAIGTSDPMNPPSVLLDALTEHHVESLATYHVLGLGPTLSRGVYAYTSRTQSSPPPNYRLIVDETFDALEDIFARD